MVLAGDGSGCTVGSLGAICAVLSVTAELAYADSASIAASTTTRPNVATCRRVRVTSAEQCFKDAVRSDGDGRIEVKRQ